MELIMKTNIKNKALLLALLFLGLQPFAAHAMNEKNSKPEEIEIVEVTSDEQGNEILTTLKDANTSQASWLPTLSSLPEMPNLGSLATKAVNTVVVTPFNKFVDSHYGGTVPEETLTMRLSHARLLV
jgi:hypothetical protein